MIPDDYLREELWQLFHNDFPLIENIEEYTCVHLMIRDCGTGGDCPSFCVWCCCKGGLKL